MCLFFFLYPSLLCPLIQSIEGQSTYCQHLLKEIMLYFSSVISENLNYNKRAPLCHIHVKKSKESFSKSPPYIKKAMETFSSKIKPDTIIQPCSMNINIPSDCIHNLSPFFLKKSFWTSYLQMTNTCQLIISLSHQHIKNVLHNLWYSNSVLNERVNGGVLYVAHNHLHIQSLKYYNFKNQEKKLWNIYDMS